MDGKSRDGTLAIVARYQDQLTCVSEPDRGIYDAMNKGIALSTGDWLYFIGSDDVLHHDRVLEEVFTNSENLAYDVLYGNVLFKHSGARYDGKFSSYKLLHKNICHQAVFVRKRVFDQLGTFDIRYVMLADWHFNMKWYHHPNIRHRHVDCLVAVYNEDGLSFNHPDEHFARDWEQNKRDYFPPLAKLLFRYRHRGGFKQFIRFFYQA